MTVTRMDNVGIVGADIDAAIEFLTELGLEFEGRAPIEGDWADGVTGLSGMRVEIAMMRTPDGHGRLEISRFLAPPVAADHRNAPVNALGYLRVMFTVWKRWGRSCFYAILILWKEETHNFMNAPLERRYSLFRKELR